MSKLAAAYDAAGHQAAARESRRGALRIFDGLGHPDAEMLRAELGGPAGGGR